MFFVSRLTIPDEELKKIGLGSLTFEYYQRERTKLVNAIVSIDSILLKIITPDYNNSPHWLFGNYFNRATRAYARIAPTTYLQGSHTFPNTIEDLVVADAHARASARCHIRLRTRIGRTEIKRRANELWADKETLKIQLKSYTDKNIVNTRYIHHLYRSIATMQGIDVRDFPFVEKALGLHIKRNEEWDNVLDALDPDGTGFIELDSFERWVSSGDYARHKSTLRTFRNSIKFGIAEILGRTFINDAQRCILLSMRRVCRLEVLLPHAHMKALIPINNMGGVSARHVSTKAVFAQREEMEEELSYQLSNAKTDDERGEMELLYRLAADDAEATCRWNFLHTRGLYQLSVESLVAKASKEILSAYGWCIPHSAPIPQAITRRKSADGAHGSDLVEISWQLSLKPLLLGFDTDCSGSFDEDEVKLLLRCVGKGLEEKKLLLAFPEVRNGTVSLEKLISYLTYSVHWERGGSRWQSFIDDIRGAKRNRGAIRVRTQNDWISSSMLLISLSRQTAKELSLAATTLTQKGQLSESDDSANQQGLMMRCQILAMRQVRLMIHTPLGIIQRLAVNKRVKEIWSEVLDEFESHRISVIKYAYRIHAERLGLLVTEIPHLIAYLIEGWNFQATERISTVIKILGSVKKKRNLKWFSEKDILHMLSPEVLVEVNEPTATVQQRRVLENRVKWRKRYDAKLSILSKARQQAVAIAMKLRAVRVPETNYRCYVLGLHSLIRDKARVAKWGIIRMNRDDSLVSWESIPKELISLLLVSKVCSLDQLLHRSLEEYVALDSAEIGLLNMELVNVDEAINVAKELNTSKYKFIQTSKSLYQKLTRYNDYIYYKRAVKAMLLYRAEIESYGGLFLNEILTGTSHCIVKQEVHQIIDN